MKGERLSDDTCQFFQHFISSGDDPRTGREGPLRDDHSRELVRQVDRGLLQGRRRDLSSTTASWLQRDRRSGICCLRVDVTGSLLQAVRVIEGDHRHLEDVARFSVIEQGGGNTVFVDING